MKRPALQTCSLFAALAVSATCAMPAWAVDLERWNADRAEWFSTVCMASAPKFVAMETNAAAAGFDLQQGHLMHAPEVSVSLQEVDGKCACYMTMGAYDPTALVQAIFERLLQDYPNAWRPENQRGAINDTYFERDGETVRLLLVPAVIEGNDWIAGRVMGHEGCQT